MEVSPSPARGRSHPPRWRLAKNGARASPRTDPPRGLPPESGRSVLRGREGQGRRIGLEAEGQGGRRRARVRGQTKAPADERTKERRAAPARGPAREGRTPVRHALREIVLPAQLVRRGQPP